MLLRKRFQQLAAVLDFTTHGISLPHPDVVGCRRVRPSLEILEDRTVPTDITYHGGPVIQNVQVNNIVTGQQPVDTTTLMQDLVRDYLPLLGPNYGIGTGTLRSAVTANPLPGSTVSDDMVQNLVLQEINSGAVPPPDGKQVYFVFLAPGQTDPTGPTGSYHSGMTVIHDSTGYHTAPPGGVPVSSGGTLNPFTIGPVYYAVVDGAHPSLATQSASHELAEAVTDPDGLTGYIDLPSGIEVADVYETQPPFIVDGFKVNILSGPQGQMIGTPISPSSPLHTPYLLGLFDAFFHGVVKANPDGTTTITDNLFGLQLVSTYNNSGNLQSVTLFGMNVTFLFESNL
jgi:hypothetical protein